MEIKYHEYLECALYKTPYDNLNSPTHVVQRDNAHYYCLMCCSYVENEHHFESKKHIQSFNLKAFELYHDTFMDFSVKLQMQQKFYIPHNATHLMCLLCSETLSQSTIYKHLKTAHLDVDKLSDVYLNASLAFVKEDISVQHLIEVYKQDHPLIFNKVGKINVCLLCAVTFTDSITTHIQTEKHATQPKARFETLHLYHKTWLQIPERYRVYSKYFYMTAYPLLICVFCKDPVFIENLDNKLKDFPCIVPNPETNHFAQALNWKDHNKQFIENDLKLECSYDKSVEGTYYPNDVMNAVWASDGIAIFTIQRILEDTKCLVCNILMDGVHEMDDILKHIESEAHKYNISKKRKLLALKSYHLFWCGQDKIEQFKQRYFEPTKVEQQKCMRCKSRIQDSSILAHYKSQCSIVTSEEQVVKCTEQVLYKSPSTSAINISAGSPLLPSVDHGLPLNRPQMVPSPSLVKPDLINAESKPDSSSRPTYQAVVLQSIYPDFLSTPCIDNLVIQTRWMNKKFCLICGMEVDDVKNHLIIKLHKKMCTKEANELLLKYHCYWIWEGNWRDQIFYNLNVPINVQCILCKAKLKLTSIKNHPCPSILRTEIKFPLAKRILDYSVTISGIIKQVLYPDIYDYISNKLLGVKFPVCSFYNKSPTCMICHITLKGEPLKIWMEHLANYHAKASPARNKSFEGILAYHQFWSQQSSTLQSLQYKFLPHDTKFMKCRGKTLVEMTVVSNHKCKICDGLKSSIQGNDEKLKKVKNIPAGQVEAKVKVSAEEKLMYTAKMLSELYPDYVNSNNLRLEHLLVQNRMDIDKFCLLCKSPVTECAFTHTIGHSECSKTAVQAALERYHKFWLNSSNVYEQIYTTPSLKEEICCSLCEGKFQYDKASKHPCLKALRKYDAKKHEKLPYLLSTISNNMSLYDPMYIAITYHYIGTKMPLVYYKKKKLVCLLCATHVSTHKTAKEWASHLEKVHLLPSAVRQEKMDYVYLFHSFWTMQDEAMKKMQFNFVPSDLGHFECSVGMSVALKDVLEHTKQCQCCDNSEAQSSRTDLMALVMKSTPKMILELYDTNPNHDLFTKGLVDEATLSSFRLQATSNNN